MVMTAATVQQVLLVLVKATMATLVRVLVALVVLAKVAVLVPISGYLFAIMSVPDYSLTVVPSADCALLMLLLLLGHEQSPPRLDSDLLDFLPEHGPRQPRGLL